MRLGMRHTVRGMCMTSMSVWASADQATQQTPTDHAVDDACRFTNFKRIRLT